MCSTLHPGSGYLQRILTRACMQQESVGYKAAAALEEHRASQAEPQKAVHAAKVEKKLWVTHTGRLCGAGCRAGIERTMAVLYAT